MNNLMDLGTVSFGGTLLIGVLAGYIAEKITGSDVGIVINLITGLVGSFIGFFLANAAGIQLGEIFSGWFWGNLVVSAIGATILLFVIKILRGRRT